MKKKKIEMKLDQNQIEFITNKVKELGSIDSVSNFYKLNDLVSKFANNLARDLFKPKRIKLQQKEK